VVVNVCQDLSLRWSAHSTQPGSAVGSKTGASSGVAGCWWVPGGQRDVAGSISHRPTHVTAGGLLVCEARDTAGGDTVGVFTVTAGPTEVVSCRVMEGIQAAVFVKPGAVGVRGLWGVEHAVPQVAGLECGACHT
jgi:hypothetical protein